VFYKKSKIIKKKKMSMLFIIALAIATVLTNLEVHIMPIIVSEYNSFGIASTFYLPWIITFYYSIVKFKFLSITPELISKDIIENINDVIILLDNKLNIMTINNKAGKLLNCSLSDIKSNNLSKIVLENISLQNEINKMINDDYDSFSTRVHFISNDNFNILIDARFKIVNDKFGDFFGILIIGNEVKELKQLKSYYKITDREAHVIQHIVNGITNKEIAKNIGTSERTVKAHISSIYDKFGVDNRAQLLGILKEFKLLPEYNSEKTIIL
jgi:DNA-binding CsgD family transcriptional regulator